MSDWQVGLALVALVGLGAALASRDPLAWVREEWRLVRAHTWATNQISGPTSKEKKAARLEKRQRAMGKRMRKKGRHLYAAGKHYVPVLTKPAATPAPRPPKADKVVSILQAQQMEQQRRKA